MTTAASRRSRQLTRVCVAGLIMLAAACGSSGDDEADSDDGVSDQTASQEASQPVGGEGPGTTLQVESGMSATYRGAVLQRSDSEDPANPVLTKVYAAFDVSVPRGESEFLSSDGFVNSLRGAPLLDLDISRLGECGNPALVPAYFAGQGHRSNQALVDGPVTLTFIRCFSLLGSAIPDEELTISASLYSSDGSAREQLAVVGAPLDGDALDDVASSIGWLHQHLDPTDRYTDGRAEWEPNVFGQTTFDRYYGDGSLQTFDTVGQRAGGGEPAVDDSFDDADAPDVGATLPPPPPPVDMAAVEERRAAGFDDGYTDGYASGSRDEDHYLESYDDPAPDLGEYDAAYDEGFDTGYADGEAATTATAPDTTEVVADDASDSGASTDTGDSSGTAVDYPTAFGPADDDFAEFELVRSIVEGMQSGAHEFQDCAVTPAGYPCIDVRAHMHADGRDHRLIASVRLEAATESYQRDLWLLIENPDPSTEPWTVTSDWWVEGDDRPDWAM